MLGFLDSLTSWLAKPHSLWDAAKQGDVTAALRFLEHGSLINQKWENKTPLMVAAVYEKTDVVQILLDHGADPNASDPKRNPVMVYRSLGYKSDAGAYSRAESVSWICRLRLSHVPNMRIARITLQDSARIW